MDKLTHFDINGNAVMVDVNDKAETKRRAIATGRIALSKSALQMILDKRVTKGDVFTIAEIAGIMAAKKTDQIIPLCHSLNLTNAKVYFEIDKDSSEIIAFSEVSLIGVTGCEMDALLGVTTALLTIYDMVKAVDKRMVIKDVHLVKKSGGKSGDFEF